MKTTDLVMDVYGEIPEHPQKVMKSLGITYQFAVPQSIGDQWWFFCCENVPDSLPEYLEKRDFGNYRELIGYGLDLGMCQAIESYYSTNFV